MRVFEVKLSSGSSTEIYLIPSYDEDGTGAIEAGKIAAEEIVKDWPDDTYEIISIRRLDGYLPENCLLKS